MPNPAESTRRDALRRFLNRASSRAAIPYVLAGLLLLAAVVVLGSEVERHIDAIEAWVTDLGAWGMVVYVGLFVLATSCLVSDSVMCIIAGAMFGMVRGFGVVVVGMLIAEVLQFAISRRLLRERIERMLTNHPSLAAIQRAVVRDEFRLQVLLRLAPLNPATINYLLGAAGVRFSRFLVASLALLPALAIEVYFGHAGKHFASLAGGSDRGTPLQNFLLIGGLAACLVVIVVISRLARNALAEALDEGPTAETGIPAHREERR